MKGAEKKCVYICLYSRTNDDVDDEERGERWNKKEYVEAT